MDSTQKLNNRLETLAWGMLFVWWGLCAWPLMSLPNGSFMLGTGLILLGLNAVRSLKNIPTIGFTTLLGIFAFVWGGLELANSLLLLPFKLPVLGSVLILAGAALLVRELLKLRQASFGSMR
jgi:hypothetical protein